MADASLCPHCREKLESSGPAGDCGACGGGHVREGGRTLGLLALEAKLEAADVSRLLGEELRRRRAPADRQVVESHYRELPYWRVGAGVPLEAAYATALVAARRLTGLDAALRPVPAATLPATRLLPPPDLTEGTALVLVPAYDIRYSVRGRTFRAVAEAHRGTIVADSWPHPLPRQVRLKLALLLLADVALFAAAAHVAPDNLVRTLALFALAVPVYFFNLALLRRGDR